MDDSSLPFQLFTLMLQWFFLYFKLFCCWSLRRDHQQLISILKEGGMRGEGTEGTSEICFQFHVSCVPVSAHHCLCFRLFCLCSPGDSFIYLCSSSPCSSSRFRFWRALDGRAEFSHWQKLSSSSITRCPQDGKGSMRGGHTRLFICVPLGLL